MAEPKDSCMQPAKGPIGVKETKSEYMRRFRSVIRTRQSVTQPPNLQTKEGQ